MSGVVAEELLVTLSRDEVTGFGFSLLGRADLPHVIYKIVENSPAADSGQVEAGDVLLRVNEVDVNRFSTKEVLKCLRLSSDTVTLKLRKDPAIKARVRNLLPQSDAMGEESVESGRASSGSPELVASPVAPGQGAANCHSSSRSNGSCSDGSGSSDLEALIPAQQQPDNFHEEDRVQWEPLGSDKFSRQKNPPRFEAYMMTGDLMLNLSRTPQNAGFLPNKQQHHHHHHHQRQQQQNQQIKTDSLRYNNHHQTTHHHHHHHHNHQNNNNHHHNHHHHQYHNSVPTSPNETLGQRRPSGGGGNSSSANSSPVGTNKRDIASGGFQADPSGSCNQATGSTGVSSSSSSSSAAAAAVTTGYATSGFVRTSRSEDQLQLQKDPSMSGVDADMDDDVTSSLNTLLDTRGEAGTQAPTSDRIVWTYNAPVSGASVPCNSSAHYSDAGSSSSSASSSSSTSSSHSSSSSTEATSPQRSLSPASPTSVSSSVMSSNSGSRRFPQAPPPSQTPTASHLQQQQLSHHPHHQLHPQQQQQPVGFFPTNGDFSQSEVISNMSSPDYNDEETMDILSARDIMMVSDPSDSDSTILASEPPQRYKQQQQQQQDEQHRIVIQVKGPGQEKESRHASPRQPKRRPGSAGSDTQHSPTAHQQRNNGLGSEHLQSSYQEFRDYEDEREQYGYEEQQRQQSGASPPHSADEESDIESLHSFHYSPKAVDLPSAVRLAKRLYSLDGFKKSDVSRHLSKNNDFSRAVAEEYLKYFNFERDTLDVALRKFLAQFSLTGETQERERVLVHFSKRYLDCNPGSFNSQDAVHTLTCAIMLLNTDLHGQNIGRKMSCADFIENLSELNDGENFPREVLKQLYNAIKSFPLEWALDEEGDEVASQAMQQGDGQVISATGNPFLDVPNVTGATEFKKGYVMRKCCYDANGKKTPFGKRGWKMYYCTLRELVLYLHKDEHGFRSDSLHNAIRIHHGLATKASDYTKKQHVFRLQTADQAEYLFQTSDSKELQSWIDTINFVCASFSSQPLAGAVGSQPKFQRPLLPCSHTKLSPREQLRDHEDRVNKLEIELDEHRRHPPERGAKALAIQNYKEKDAYLHFELKRYKTYAYLLRSRLAYTEMEPSLAESCIGEVDEGSSAFVNADVALVPPPVPERTTNSSRLDPTTT
ncbi:uncharacterized protein LOC106636094 [Copidosoma floridanum]|uniref:uncharacterized protein LOC106636094 n=1 Tax=Copidosoma floridanum TaxID=29053 RepID=UPI000C6FB932|nr:uncharacterized protein LOC106636094 [Copidosoma floridanum]